MPTEADYSSFKGTRRNSIWQNTGDKPAVKSIPINDKDLAGTDRKANFELLDQLEIEQARDKRHLFEKYDDYRLKQLFDLKSTKQFRHRSCNDEACNNFKSVAFRRIEFLRNDTGGDLDAETIRKQKKFLNYILNLKTKTALRKWKEEVFGQPGSAALRLLMIDERDKMRTKFY